MQTAGREKMKNQSMSEMLLKQCDLLQFSNMAVVDGYKCLLRSKLFKRKRRNDSATNSSITEGINW